VLHSLEQKARVGLAVAAVVLILIGALSYISTVRLHRDVGLVDHTHQVQNSLTQLMSDLTTADAPKKKSGSRTLYVIDKSHSWYGFAYSSVAVCLQTSKPKYSSTDQPSIRAPRGISPEEGMQNCIVIIGAAGRDFSTKSGSNVG
jgi:hypothetical protein